MSVKFAAVGRVGTNPEQLTIGTGEDASPLVRFRVYFDGSVKSEDGYEDKYGFWRDIEIWREGLGKRVAQHIRKGMLIAVQGTEICKKREKDGEEYENYAIRADAVSLELVGVKSIEMAPKASDAEDDSARDAA
ncbi:single-stranded DNA-binding protein [Hyphococcus luteus]|uniref:Helix-destabilizing protein n=1 Tax=Hyphococcus luteus TaxID=2058213 RepID=A0A2S7K087_9PROT|nr:single-stranded DNA-binding protein [Marinicaulis flavus]PQA85886.1 hypothetical protein CW354_20375 [Marinicaulis flavus]